MRIGLIVNPVAGLGGPLAFHGSDGPLAGIALRAGAMPQAGERAKLALSELSACRSGFQLLTSSGAMGADPAAAAGLSPLIIHSATTTDTTSKDTVAAALALLECGVNLLLFAGGDGTARDLLEVLSDRLPVVGIPTGVKMHSGVFASTPRAAGRLICAVVSRRIDRSTYTLSDVIDREVENGAPRLYGAMMTPAEPWLLQPAKAVLPHEEGAQLRSASRFLAERLREAPITLIGPGTTTLCVKDALQPGGSLLGVDAFAYGALLATDADEATLLSLVQAHQARLLLGVIGGQGFLLGRGNQQISARVVRAVGRDRVEVIAGAAKLAALPGGRLRVDTGDTELDTLLAGFIPVHVAARRTMLMRIVPT